MDYSGGPQRDSVEMLFWPLGPSLLCPPRDVMIKKMLHVHFISTPQKRRVEGSAPSVLSGRSQRNGIPWL